MTTDFLTEAEADEIIAQNICQILRKIRCATSANVSCAAPGAEPEFNCGCCGVPG